MAKDKTTSEGTSPKYIITDEYLNKEVWAHPDYYRKDGDKFILNSDLTQQDFAFLKSLGHQGIIKVE